MAHGVSGYEFMNQKAVAEEAMKGLVDEIRSDTFGNVIGLKRGQGEGERPRIMLAGHMDEIGLMVTKIEEKVSFVSRRCGVDRASCRAMRLSSREAASQASLSQAPHLTPPGEADKAVKM